MQPYQLGAMLSFRLGGVAVGGSLAYDDLLGIPKSYCC